MISLATAKKLALRFEGAEEQPHFEKSSVRVKKKIFITFNEPKAQACVKLSEVDQSVFCSYNKGVVFPVPNKWGKQGWTLVALKKVPKELFHDILTRAYCAVAPKSLAEKYQQD